jgi:hypothetical protein
MRILKNIVFRSFAVLLGFIIAFSLGELGLRLIRPQRTGPVTNSFHEELGQIPVPHQHGQRSYYGMYNFTYSNNSFGFRGPKEASFEKTANYRVLLLGDSFTYGIGVNDDQTFAHQIEHNLSGLPGGLEVINAGNGGKGTDYALKLFQTMGDKFKADLVALCFFSNDFSDNEHQQYFSFDSDGRLTPKPLVSPLNAKQEFIMGLPGYNWLMSWSHLGNLLSQTLLTYLTSDISPKNTNVAVFDYNKTHRFSNDSNSELTELYLRNLLQSVNNTNSKLIIFYIPNFIEVNLYRKDSSFLIDEEIITSSADKLGIKFYSLTPIISDTNYKIDDLYYKEGHWTATGHRIAGDYMSSIIKQYLVRISQGDKF